MSSREINGAPLLTSLSVEGIPAECALAVCFGGRLGTLEAVDDRGWSRTCGTSAAAALLGRTA